MTGFNLDGHESKPLRKICRPIEKQDRRFEIQLQKRTRRADALKEHVARR